MDNRTKHPHKTISNFKGEDGIFEMPPTRFIGIRHNHLPGEEGRDQLGEFLSSTFSSKMWNDVIQNLPNVINNELCDLTCEYVAKTDSFSFIVGVFSPAGTPVPDGLDYRDIMPTLVWISQKDVAGHTGKSKKIPDGYEISYGTPAFPWQAFLRADSYSVNPIKMKEK